MSEGMVTKKVDESQRPSASMSAPLTTANLAAHTAATSATHEEPFNMQRWLAYTGDNQSGNRERSDWGRLAQQDDLAAAIEDAIQHEGNVQTSSR